MDNIIDAKPAKYPENSTQEANSVHKFQNLINKKFIKPDIKTLDKIPNVDGILTIVTEEQIPIGRLDVQIKTLPEKNNDTPKHQCDVEFLSYCEHSQLPVLIIVVSESLDIAYWLHITKGVLKELKDNLKGDSISVKIPIENIISKADTEYIEKWTEIADSHCKMIKNSQVIVEKYEEALDLIEILRTSPIQTHSIPKECIHKLQRFLTSFNNSLDESYYVIKKLYYPEYWKIGVAYSNYLVNSLTFILYPILNGQNDILLREIAPESPFEERGIRWIGLSGKNPIDENPEKYANQLIANDVIKAIEEKHLRIMTEELALEYIVDAVDNIYSMAGLRLKTRYNFKTVLERLHNFYPLWFEEYMTAQGSKLKDGTIIFESNMSNIPPLSAFAMKEIAVSAIKRYRQGEKPRNQVVINTGNSTDLQYVVSAFNFLWNTNAQTLNRIYPRFRSSDKPSFRWELLTPQELKDKVKNIYSILPDLIEAFVVKYFPRLESKVKFFNDFDKIVINVKYETSISKNDHPAIEKFYFKSQNNVRQTIDVYLNGENCPVHRESRFEYHKNGLEIDGQRFRLVASSDSLTSDFLKDFSLHDIFQETLINRFKSYFKEITE